MSKVLRFIVYTNIWVALAVVALVQTTFLTLGKFHGPLLFFCFFATLLMYAYARWFSAPARIDVKKSSLTTWKEGHKLLYFFGGLTGAAGMLIFVFQLQLQTLIWLTVCAVVSALYPLQFLKHGQLALRNLAGVKLFVISAVWAVVTVILPVVEIGLPITAEIILLTVQRFLFIMAITIPFDIRDLRIDSPDLNTIPYKYGVKTARQIALIAIFIAQFLGVVLIVFNQISVGVFVGQLVGFVIAAIFIFASTPKKPDLFFSFGVEGTSIMLFLATYIFTYFWP